MSRKAGEKRVAFTQQLCVEAIMSKAFRYEQNALFHDKQDTTARGREQDTVMRCQGQER